MRGFVICADCGNPLTACWSTGRSGRHPYYLCFKKNGCPSYRKSIRRDVLEGDFEALLKQMRPSENLFRAARAMFEDLWNHRLKTGAEQARSLKVELARIEREVDQFLDRIADATIPSIVKAYEGRIQKLELQKIELSEKIAKCGRPIRSFDETLRTACDFLENPYAYGFPSIWRIKGQC